MRYTDLKTAEVISFPEREAASVPGTSAVPEMKVTGVDSDAA